MATCSEIAEELRVMLLTLPVIEAQRKLIQEAIDKLEDVNIFETEAEQ